MVTKKVKPTESTILLDRSAKRVAAFADLHPRVFSSVASLHESKVQGSRNSLWISYSVDLTNALVKRITSSATLGLGLFIHPLDAKSIPALSRLFRRIAFTVDGGFLPADELAEALISKNRANLFIGGFVNPATETATFWRGNLHSLTVPLASFETSGDGMAPDFTAMSVIDGGQTVKLGDYEAAVDAILYEHDPEYRRELSQRRLREDRSFGAALRRLRKQRGLRLEDFEPAVAAKTVARIEQGKVQRVQKSTLESLAKRLAVSPAEIGTY